MSEATQKAIAEREKQTKQMQTPAEPKKAKAKKAEESSAT